LYFVFQYQIWVFNLQASQHFHCFRIYRETLARFSWPPLQGAGHVDLPVSMRRQGIHAGQGHRRGGTTQP
ncbi:hypothetical protein ABLN72_06980, partial [Mycobacterium tuberculosis]